MMHALLRYLERCGIACDVAINVMTGGDLGHTVSYRVAVAAQEGRRWGCLFCWFLDWTVQRNHCQRQFGTVRGGALAFIRAGTAFTVAAMFVLGLGHMAADFVRFALL